MCLPMETDDQGSIPGVECDLHSYSTSALFDTYLVHRVFLLFTLFAPDFSTFSFHVLLESFKYISFLLSSFLVLSCKLYKINK